MRQKRIYPELKKIENEIQNLKILIIKTQQMPKQVVSLKGMLKGITVTEEDIKAAKNLYSNSVLRRYVTDAHGFIWFLTGDEKLGGNARGIFLFCKKGIQKPSDEVHTRV